MKRAWVMSALVVGEIIGGFAAGAAEGPKPAGQEVVATKEKAETGDKGVPGGPEPVVLWRAGTRIPHIEVTNKGTLLAFAQKGGGDNHPNNVEMRRSTDGGKTWGEAKDLFKEWVQKQDEQITGGKEFSGANPCPLVDRQTGEIWLFSGMRFVGGPEKMVGKGMHYVRSSDDGLTWSYPELLALEDGKPAGGVPSTGRGIQLSTGRLLLPHFRLQKDASEPISATRVLYSDDHGKTWRLHVEEAAAIEKRKRLGSCEFNVLELADGRVYMNHRANGKARRRAVAFSADGGLTWSDPQSAADLIEPTGTGCHSGLIRLTHPKTDDKSRVLFSCPWGWGKANFGRQDLAVLISYDECQTWKPLKMIQAGGTGYSNLVVLPDKSIGCIYEFSDLGHKDKIWCQIRYVRFTLDWLTDGKDKVVAKDQPGSTGGQPATGAKEKE